MYLKGSFLFFQDDLIKRLLSELLAIEYFNIVPTEVVGGDYHFRSIVLRKL